MTDQPKRKHNIISVRIDITGDVDIPIEHTNSGQTFGEAGFELMLKELPLSKGTLIHDWNLDDNITITFTPIAIDEDGEAYEVDELTHYM